MPQQNPDNPAPEPDRPRNHLAGSTSPYLLQHASNPVDWYPWGEEAFARAKREDKPIFLSIGYSACHWCHVMERESFENEEIAALLNRNFVAIKVDREERPDVDAVYMKFVQLTTGSGGWPMSVFLTPTLKPFYGGTYFPPDDRWGKPGFRRLLSEIARLWHEDRSRLEKGADDVVAILRRPSVTTDRDATAPATETLLQQGETTLLQTLDQENGGFGGAPKFPPSMALEFLMRRYVATGNPHLLDAVTLTLDAMLRGGIHDHVGGGFHRYSVDDHWLVPHFEKMLYDNALLARIYLDAYLLTGHERYAATARDTLDFILRDMRDAGGAFHTSWDADSDGGEGKVYLWTRADIRRVLPPAEADLFCRVYHVGEGGDGAGILHRTASLAELAKAEGITPAELDRRLRASSRLLLAARQKRPQPHRDDKVLTNWSALAISAFARAGPILNNPHYPQAARQAAAFLLHTMVTDRRLLHSWRRGRPGAPANLDDYAYLIMALIDLYQVDPDSAHVEAAKRLGRDMLERFYDPKAATFTFVEADRPHLIAREECIMDNATPAAAPMAAAALARLARLTENDAFKEAAEAAMRTAGTRIARFPAAAMTALNALDADEGRAMDVVIAGPSDAPETRKMVETIQKTYRPNLLLCQWNPEGPDADDEVKRIPLLKNRTMIEHRPTAYVCRNRTCRAPVTDAETLRRQLDIPATP